MQSNFQRYFEQYAIGPYHYSAPSMALIILGLLLILAFEVWMLIDVLAYRKVPAKSRVWWVIGMFVIHPFVALVYLLMRSRYKAIK
jgi:hypothetical protein